MRARKKPNIPQRSVIGFHFISYINLHWYAFKVSFRRATWTRVSWQKVRLYFKCINGMKFMKSAARVSLRPSKRSLTNNIFLPKSNRGRYTSTLLLITRVIITTTMCLHTLFLLSFCCSYIPRSSLLYMNQRLIIPTTRAIALPFVGGRVEMHLQPAN